MPKGGMLPLDDLAEIASALARVDLDTLLVVDRRHYSLVQSRFDGNVKGPLRFVSLARAAIKKLRIFRFDVEHPFTDLQQFCRALRNCYVSFLWLRHAHLYGPVEVAALLAIRDDYVVNQTHISARDVTASMLLLEALPQCAGLKWDFSYPVTGDLFSCASVQNVRYLYLTNDKNLDVNAMLDWLRLAPGKGSGVRRMTLMQDYYEFDAAELARRLKKEFLGDTHSREYELFVFGAQVTVGDIRDEALTNAFGDVLEVETSSRDRALCVTRLSKVNAKRTTILSSTDGPKVWNFATIRDLDNFLISNGVTELLARSELIANEKACKCGEPMTLRLRTPSRCHVSNAPSNTEIDNYVWKCSRGCRDSHGGRYSVKLDDDSAMKPLVKRLGDCVLLLRAVILLCIGKTDDEILAALQVTVRGIAPLRVVHASVMRLPDHDGGDEVRARLMNFYAIMKSEHRRKGPHTAYFVSEQ